MPIRTLLVVFALAIGHIACSSMQLRAPLHGDTPPGTWYIVKSGDTAVSIAERAGIPLEDLLEANGISKQTPLEPGRLIFILRESTEIVMGGTPSIQGSSLSGKKDPSNARRYDFQWPIRRPILTSPFGTRWGRQHEGIDIAASIGTPVLAAAAGTVLYAGDRVKGYGHMVVLQHAEGIVTVYAHNSSLRVRTGDRVMQGQEIALAGDSGRSTAPHLHFEIRRGESPEDPIPFLPPLK